MPKMFFSILKYRILNRKYTSDRKLMPARQIGPKDLQTGLFGFFFWGGGVVVCFFLLSFRLTSENFPCILDTAFWHKLRSSG